MTFQTQALDYIARSFRRIKRKSEVGKFFNYIDNFILVLVVYGEIYTRRILLCRMFHIEARGNKPFKQSFFNRLAYSKNFTRRLHFGTELRIHVVKFFERKNGNFNCNVRRIFIKPRSVTEVFKLRAEQYSGRDIDHRHAGYLRNIRYSSRRSRIHFDYIKLVMVNEILNIDKSLGF